MLATLETLRGDDDNDEREEEAIVPKDARERGGVRISRTLISAGGTFRRCLEGEEV